MEKSTPTKQISPVRRAVYRALTAGLGSAVGAMLARPLVGAFRESAPWVFPAFAAGLIAALVLAGLLLPLYFQRKLRR